MTRAIGWPTAIGGTAIGISVLVLTNSESPIRPALAFWFLLVCPGMAFVRLLQVKNGLSELTLAIALSIALSTIVSETMVYLQIWSPQWGLFVLVCLSAVGVTLQVAQSRVQVGRVLRPIISRIDQCLSLPEQAGE